MIRTFLAIELSHEGRRRLTRHLRPIMYPADPAVRWTPPIRWHVTLQFLGDVEPSEIMKVCRAAELAARSVPPFPWRLTNLGAFPNVAKPQVVWVGIEDQEGGLTSLRRALDQSLGEIGFPPEDRPFRPHITVGRIPRGGRPSPQTLALLADPPHWTGPLEQTDSLQVMSSNLDRGGAEYAVLANLPLG
jgi:2'-5' RNA ligase